MSFVRPDLEQVLLGNFLMDPSLLTPDLGLLEGAFNNSSNCVIFRHMQALVRASQPLDLHVLTDRLESSGELEGIGGIARIGELITGVVERNDTEIRAYVEILNRCCLEREISRCCEALLWCASNEGVFNEKILANLENLSARLRNGVRAENKLNFQTAADISVQIPDAVSWIAKPWVVAGGLTDLSGKAKSAGKTTFVLHMVAAVLEGTHFLGEATKKTPVVYLTEQPLASFREALRGAYLLDRQDLSILAWGDARKVGWNLAVDAAIRECKRIGARLLVVDTFPQFAQLLGDSENNAGDVLAALSPLQGAVEQGVSVLMVRHERKSGGDVGDSGRGSSAFAGAVDIVLSIRRPEENTRRTLRQIQARARFSETPEDMTIELTAGGYVSHGHVRNVAAATAETGILNVLHADEGKAITEKEIVKATKSSRPTIQTVLESLLSRKEIVRVGAGKKANPFRYFRPEIDSAQTSSYKEQQEMGTENANNAPARTRPRAPEAVETCPLCGESGWRPLPGGGRVCGVCHPSPLETGEVAANESSKSWTRTSTTNGLGG